MKKYLIIMVLSFVAIVNASYLSYIAFSEMDSFCDISEALSCSAALTNPATIFFGIPFPTIALIAYPIIFLIALWGYKTKKSENFLYLILLSIGGILFNSYIIYQEFLIGAYCPLCLMCSVIIVSIFIMSYNEYKKYGKK
jgi:uncharacterized membrane protein